MTPEERLKEIENKLNDELFSGQAWYAAVSSEDFVWLFCRVKQLTEALEFYADERTSWFAGGLEGHCGAYSGDMGDRARKVLEEE